MTLGKGLLKKITLIIFITACFAMVGSPVFAAAPQENPDTAAVVFSGVSLFQFYSSTLDSVLAKNQKDIEANIQQSPFANVPPDMEDSFNKFLSSANNLCSQILGLDVSVSNTKLLLQESRYEDATPLNSAAFDNLTTAEENLSAIEQATNIAGGGFQVTSTSSDNSVATSYNMVLDRIQRLNNLLNLYHNMLQEQQTEILDGSLLPSSDITLETTTSEAFVGDTVSVEGNLSTNGKPLSNRQVEILLNGSQYLTVTTDAQGHYLGSLQLPYWYISVIQIQSLYYPQAGDVGVYQLALSPSVPLKVLFYDAVLTLKTDANAYPGRETAIVGQIDYGSSPIPDTRNIQISLDNTPVKESDVTDSFTEIITLPADLEVGKHLVVVSVPATGKYDLVVANATLNVVKAIPVILTSNLPSVVLIPGSFNIHGKLNSEIGPVTQARLSMTFEGKQVNAVSGDNGAFNASIRNNIGFGLFGSQSLELKVIPNEPWQTSLTASYKIMTVYMINCGVFFLILLFLAVVLPRRLKFRGRMSLRKKLPQEVAIAQQESAAASVSINDDVLTDVDNLDRSAPHSRLFYWYRIVIRLIQRVSGVLLKPNQTLREYAIDTSKATGAAGKPILEFTRMIEKVLYSPHQVTEEDAKNGEQLARKVRESIRK